jgi:VCBS repeat-containing protein
MASMTFLINDSSTGGSVPVVQVVITENSDGSVSFKVTQLAGYVGDLRGLFFDLADETLVGSLTAAGTGLTDLLQGNDTVIDLGGGANMQGLSTSDGGGYDVGVEIGSSGIKSNDDFRWFEFTLDSATRNLTLADFSNVSFGARVTSVGLDANLDGSFETARSGSSKTGEITFAVITPTKDCVAVQEDAGLTGNLLANDGVGAGDVLTVTGWSGGALNTDLIFSDLGNVKVRVDSNGSYSVDASAADALAAGETISHTFSYQVLQTNAEGTSTHTVSFKITVTGSNDAPVVAVTDATGAVSEPVSPVGDLTDSGTIDFSDVDLTDVHSVGAVTPSAGALGTLTASVTTDTTGAGVGGVVTWHYSVAASAVDYLAHNEIKVETFSFDISDGQGGSVTRTVGVTITGSNDAPTVEAGEVQGGAVVEDVTVSTSGSFSFADVDLADAAHAVAVTPPAGALGTLIAQVDDESSGDGAGSVGWTYTLDNAAAQSLREGAVRTESFTVTLSDDFGASVDKVVTITITGTNDRPLLEIGNASGALTEGDGAATLSDSGALSFSDVDVGDAVTVSFTPASAPAWSGGPLAPDLSAVLAAGFSVDAASWQYSTNANLDFLGAGQTITMTFDVVASDNSAAANAASAPQTVTIVITGSNDAPVLGGIVSGYAYTDTSQADLPLANILAGTLTNGDPDSGDSAVYSIDGGAPSGLAGFDQSLATPFGTLHLRANSGYYQFVPDAAAIEALKTQQSVSFDLTVTDGLGARDTQTLTIGLNGANDTPELSATLTSAQFTDTATDNSFTALDGQLSTLDRDAPETATYSIAGGAADITQPGFDLSQATAYGTLYLSSSSGAYRFVPNDAGIEALKTEQSVSFELVVTDGSGDTASQTLAITLHGANDTLQAVADGNAADPVVESGVFPGNTPVPGDALASGNVLANDIERDASDALFVLEAGGSMLIGPTQVQGTYGRLTIGSDGTWSYELGNGYPDTQALPQGAVVQDTFAYTVGNSAGETSTAALAITIVGTNDAPRAFFRTASIAEDATYTSSDVTANVDDDSFIGVGNIGFSQAANGSVVLNANGSFTYTPNADFNGTDSWTYTVTDSLGASDTATITVNVLAVNDAPINVVPATRNAVEDSAVVIGGLAVSDVDAGGGTLTVTLAVSSGTLVVGGGGAAVSGSGTGNVVLSGTLAQINATLSAANSVSYLPSADFNGSATLTMSSSDNGNSGSGGALGDTDTMTIVVAAVNDAPVITSDGGGDLASISIAENTTAVTTVTSTDVDSASRTYSVVGGADAARFTIDASSGALAFVAAPDFEVPTDAGGNNVYDVRVQVSDGSLTDTQDIAVAVTDVVEGTLTGPTALAFNLTALQGNGNGLPLAATTLGSFTAIDADGGSFTYSETSDAGNVFNVTATTGQVTINTGFVQGMTYTLGALVTDELGRTADQTLVVQVGGNGDETLNGSAAVNLQYGQNGADILFGGAGNDALQGGNGTNQLHGQEGADRLYGNSQSDTFYFDTALGSGGIAEVAEVDTLYNFNGSGGNPDTVWLDKSFFSSLATTATPSGAALRSDDFLSVSGTGATANAGTARIIYDSNTGALYYDADGGTAANRTLFAAIDVSTDSGTIDNNDFRVGP